MVYRIFSFGGGVQSTAVMVLQALGKVKYDEFVYADVGDDSEHPDTIQYLNNIVIPFCAEHGIKLTSTAKTRYGQPDTVYQSAMRDNRSIPLPILLPSGAYGNRTCTGDFKIKVVDKYIRSLDHQRVVIGLGFSSDENRRAINKPVGWHDHHKRYKFGFNKCFEFPLLRLYVSRNDCHNIIRGFGLPQPSSSACWFCPFRSRSYWYRMKNQNPEMFQKAIELEQRVNEKRAKVGRDMCYLHKDAIPLKELPNQPSLFDALESELGCETGYCGL